MWWVFGFLWVLSSTNETDHHNITEILLKVVLNTIILTLTKNVLNTKSTICIKQYSVLLVHLMHFYQS